MPGRVLAMLSVKDTMTLDFERSWWKYGGAKEAAILDQFGESSTRYYQRLNALIDAPEAWEYAPLLVKRLQRIRRDRRRARGTRPPARDCIACGTYAPTPRLVELEWRQGLAGEEDQSVPGWDSGA